jgi:GNAT superfamily N-acetyltransferase
VQDTVRAATADDLDGLVAVLTAAFHDDPLMSWAFPDADVRPRRLAAMWRFMGGEGYVPFGASTVVPGAAATADAAALWLAPGQDLDEGFWASRGHDFAVALEYDLDRLSSLSDLMAAHHPSEPHWYLMAIGVSPDRQGGRLGSALLAHTLATADASGAPAYLEATSVRSRGLYERVGFVATGEFAAPGGPPVWPMWREPA